MYFLIISGVTPLLSAYLTTAAAVAAMISVCIPSSTFTTITPSSRPSQKHKTILRDTLHPLPLARLDRPADLRVGAPRRAEYDNVRNLVRVGHAKLRGVGRVRPDPQAVLDL